MHILDLIERDIDDDQLELGCSLSERGEIHDLTMTARGVTATAGRTPGHRVSLEVATRSPRVSCSCPHIAATRRPCGHIWATLVEAMDRFPEFAAFDSSNIIGRRNRGTKATRGPRPPAWESRLVAIARAVESRALEETSEPRWATGALLYVVDIDDTLSCRAGDLHVSILGRARKRNGDWGKPKTIRRHELRPGRCEDATDRLLTSLLVGAAAGHDLECFLPHASLGLPAAIWPHTLPLLAGSGRARVRLDDEEPSQWPEFSFDPGPPWRFHLEVVEVERRGVYEIRGSLRRDETRVPIEEPRVLLANGLVIMGGTAAWLDHGGAFAWILALRRQGSIRVPAAEREVLLERVMACGKLPALDLPPELRIEEIHATPVPRLLVRRCELGDAFPDRLRGDLSFDYDGKLFPFGGRDANAYDSERRRLLRRDAAAEAAAVERLRTLELKQATGFRSDLPEFLVPPKRLPELVTTLSGDGWKVVADGKLHRVPSAFQMSVTSGIDWFDLEAKVEFGDMQVPLPALLAAFQRKERTVLLDDGSLGMLPEEWLQHFGFLATAVALEGGRLRFRRTQALLLDALLAAQPEARCDEVFARTRAELEGFERVAPRDPPPGFTGTLRPYQRDGLGWFEFLERFRFGGCLADDMGLGKTVQVLALIEARREQKQVARGAAGGPACPIPSLVVVPRSLLFNWKQEAARFAPQLRILDHAHPQRTRTPEGMEGFDLVLTTYGTLRRDIHFLKDARFDYVILDEAHAIKNPASDSAKAARLLQGEHRLALSGTPVQNHLGDLWSLFEFLNPGMLGSASVFANAAAELRNPEAPAREILGRALRPFVLRRTKEQVARDLPPRVEQTLYCELEPAQRALYDELRAHYRGALLGRVDRDGLKKSKIMILEALLRLRQAALHPGLIDAARAGDSSAKLDLLLPQLDEVLDEGHKALVFSQFTEMLAIVRRTLDARGVRYEYLDGKTRDRQTPVERFQTDPESRLFLISIKAGGLGLNLTAADYVFLLDPWWNPAVEAQAIDRTHRIGQTRQVFACRLISKDTVEEKVLALQESKRRLADAIITADHSLIRDLDRADLELLLS